MNSGMNGPNVAPSRSAVRVLKTRPLVSVVIPCYNYKRFLHDTVQSVLDQEGVDLDVIIVDDCSTDGSGQAALQLASADPRIRAVVHSVNMGHIATYNDGLSRVAGEYVVLLSADDLLAPGSLERSTALLEEHPEVGLVYGYAQEFHEVPAPAPEKEVTWSLWSGQDWIALHCRRGSNIIVNPEAVLRRSIMDALVGYRPDMPHAADMDLWLRAASLTGVGRVNGPVQAYYRVHGANMHLTNFDSPLDDIRARREVFDGIESLPGMQLVHRRTLVRTARKSMAIEALREAIHLADSDTDSTGSAAELAAFAADTDASVVHSRLWSSYLRRQHAATWVGERSISAAAYRWRWAYRWRRWRRAGI